METTKLTEIVPVMMTNITVQFTQQVFAENAVLSLEGWVKMRFSITKLCVNVTEISPQPQYWPTTILPQCECAQLWAVCLILYQPTHLNHTFGNWTTLVALYVFDSVKWTGSRVIPSGVALHCSLAVYTDYYVCVSSNLFGNIVITCLCTWMMREVIFTNGNS